MPPKRKQSDVIVVGCDASDFRLTSHQVVTGLATLQSAVQDLSRAYIAHTNTVLGRAPGTAVDLLTSASFVSPLADAGLLAHRAPSPGARSDVGEKKKKKRTHDPNAPKRPLTPYFLYMQSARSVIASDLGSGAKPGEISAEGTRRWKAMPDNEKHLWKVAYEANLPEYRSRVAAYKASIGAPDAAAAQLAAENGATVEDEDVADPDAAEEEEEPVEPAKAPSPPKTPKTSKRRKSAKDREDEAAASSARQTAVAPPAGVKETAVLPPTATKEKSPDKKRKRGKGKKDDEAAPAPSAPSAAASQTKDKRTTKRKRKSDAVADE
ncbi:MAG: hypothetical protein M1832_004956 [Thelocarpon impressellum]|nr:MAG: hypothetical protein M1832_004956 [Thelocarpon impressellum]